ncbi:alpha/beta hydrolase family protein [Arthrobacter monumenti]
MNGKRISYGPDASQYGELYLPEERSHPGIVVIIHGGYWRSRYGAELGVPLAKDLSRRGWVCWNLEYRRVGNGGGWPGTFEDIATGIDKLAELAPEHGLDLDAVVALGHSAGGHLATWAAGRYQLPAGAPGPDPVVKLTAVVSQAGLLDLRSAFDANLSNNAAAELLGGTPTEYPRRYEWADPLSQVPLRIPVYALHAEDDTAVPISQSTSYVAAAVAAGASADLIPVRGGHFDLIDPGSEAFTKCRELLARAMGEPWA